MKFDLRPRGIIFESQLGVTSVDFDVVRKVILGGHVYPLINKAKKKSNQVSILGKYSLNFFILLRFIYELDK